MGGVIKKIAHIASILKPFIAMIPVVGPMIAKGIDIANMCIMRVQQARQICKGQGLAVLDEAMSKMGPSGDNKKQAVTNRLNTMPDLHEAGHALPKTTFTSTLGLSPHEQNVTQPH
ncbi:MAG: hypothetical protein JWM80_4258 [Cyanobacteria bacterium RYN_339]|nr:hypothetical protein [Cyanobacteria bacterium RYN_339]